MRLSIVLLIVSLVGVLGGAWLIGLPAFGAAVIFDSLAVGALGVLTLELPDRVPPAVHDAPTLGQVLEKARNAS